MFVDEGKSMTDLSTKPGFMDTGQKDLAANLMALGDDESAGTFNDENLKFKP